MADETKPVDLTAVVQALTAKHGDAEKALAKLVDENHDYRDKLREVKAKLAEAEKLKPAEGSVVLAPADAAVYAAYQALGKPADITAQIEAGTAAITKAATMEREKVVTDAAALLNWKGSVLSELAAHPTKGFTVEIRDEPDPKDAAKKVKASYAKAGDAAAVPLASYVTSHFADFVPALAASTAQQQPGVTYPVQRPAGGPTPPENAVDAALAKNAERAKAPNALRPASKAA